MIDTLCTTWRPERGELCLPLDGEQLRSATTLALPVRSPRQTGARIALELLDAERSVVAETDLRARLGGREPHPARARHARPALRRTEPGAAGRGHPPAPAAALRGLVAGRAGRRRAGPERPPAGVAGQRERHRDRGRLAPHSPAIRCSGRSRAIPAARRRCSTPRTASIRSTPGPVSITPAPPPGSSSAIRCRSGRAA